jgi:hypothetical protein
VSFERGASKLGSEIARIDFVSLDSSTPGTKFRTELISSTFYDPGPPFSYRQQIKMLLGSTGDQTRANLASLSGSQTLWGEVVRESSLQRSHHNRQSIFI